MIGLFITTISITLSGYLKTVLLDASIEGARYAALADQSVESGIAKTRQLIESSIGLGLEIRISGSELPLGETGAIQINSEATAPFGFGVIAVSARGANEG